MRKVIENQLKIGQTDIGSIVIDLRCRDEINQVLLGLQYIHCNRQVRKQVYEILSGIVPREVDADKGRPGMNFWKILVLGTLRHNCNWDYDKLHNMSNNHKNIREFLGHTNYDHDQIYGLQTIKDNVSLLRPELIAEINELIVKTGHDLIQHNEEEVVLKTKCDSFVVETDVHFPTDINLLLDAIRKIIFRIGHLCEEMCVTEWRQYRYVFKKIKKKFNYVNRLRRSSSKNEQKKQKRDQLILDAHREYVDLVESYVLRAKCSIETLGAMGAVGTVLLIENYIAHAERQIDQIRRRVLEGETIPHHEKVFSIFEEHTEWINKGKAGVPQELGLAVCIVEDQYGFILHHHVMEKQKDVELAVPVVVETKRRFPTLASCSFDKGFYSPDKRQQLKEILDYLIMPKKGKLSEADKQVEYSEEFIEARRRHAAVESAINALENHGLDRCLDFGIDGFKRYVAISVLARNIQLLGAIIRKRYWQQEKRRQALAA